jgi:hypothetical protein
VRLALPMVVEAVPDGHAVHRPTPRTCLSLYRPRVHATHAVLALASSSVVPAAQFTQADFGLAPPAEYEPGAQDTHAVLLSQSASCIPGGHTCVQWNCVAPTLDSAEATYPATVTAPVLNTAFRVDAITGVAAPSPGGATTNFTTALPATISFIKIRSEVTFRRAPMDALNLFSNLARAGVPGAIEATSTFSVTLALTATTALGSAVHGVDGSLSSSSFPMLLHEMHRTPRVALYRNSPAVHAAHWVIPADAVK